MKEKTQKANITEIFSSSQGEGLYIGQRQIFVRFANCNLSCSYCDTIFLPIPNCNIETAPGSALFRKTVNPLDENTLIKEVNKLLSFAHHSLSLTGGEPLLQADFLSSFLDKFNPYKKKKKLKIFLETNGTLNKELKMIIKNLDIISMDIKLESSTGLTLPFDEHKKFIETAKVYNKDFFAKIVVNSQVTEQEVSQVISLLKDVQAPLIIQPVSSDEKDLIPNASLLLKLQQKLLENLKDVRIIPQSHKFLNLL